MSKHTIHDERTCGGLDLLGVVMIICVVMTAIALGVQIKEAIELSHRAQMLEDGR